MINIVHFLLCASGLYICAGVLVTGWLYIRGLEILDPTVKGSSRAFRIVIFPGMVALWPLILAQYVKRGSSKLTEANDSHFPARQRSLHGQIFRIIGFALPILFGAALWWRAEDLPLVTNVKGSQLPNSHTVTNAQRIAAKRRLIRNNLPKFPVESAIILQGARFFMELRTPEQLPNPIIAVYWYPEVLASPGLMDALPSNSVYLGTVWGPSRLEFTLPFTTMTDGNGTLIYYALGENAGILASDFFHME